MRVRVDTADPAYRDIHECDKFGVEANGTLLIWVTLSGGRVVATAAYAHGQWERAMEIGPV